METTLTALTQEALNNEIQILSNMLSATRIEDVRRIRSIANKLTNLVATETHGLTDERNIFGSADLLIAFNAGAENHAKDLEGNAEFEDATQWYHQYIGETDDKFKYIHSNPDARIWSEYYKSHFPDADVETIHGWFANAMMAMSDYIHQTKTVLDKKPFVPETSDRQKWEDARIIAVKVMEKIEAPVCPDNMTDAITEIIYLAHTLNK